jgi:hypothetical protein
MILGVVNHKDFFGSNLLDFLVQSDAILLRYQLFRNYHTDKAVKSPKIGVKN